MVTLFRSLLGLVRDGPDRLLTQPVGERVVEFLWAFFRTVDRALRLPCPPKVLKKLAGEVSALQENCQELSLLRLLFLYHAFSPLCHPSLKGTQAKRLREQWRKVLKKVVRSKSHMREYWLWDIPRLRKSSWLVRRFQ